VLANTNKTVYFD